MRKIKYNNGGIMIGVGVVLLVIAATTFLWFLLRGETKIVTKGPEITSNASLICSIENYNYPFFTYDNSSNTATEITIVFDGDNIGSITLIHKSHYDDNSKASTSSSVNHAAMNRSFGSELGADALSANFNVSNGTMRMSLYANRDTLNVLSRKYFLIDSALSTRNQYEKYYTDRGFKCSEKTN